MVKKIITESGRTFNEFCLLPDYTKENCTIQNITLKTKLAEIKLKIPFLSAAMTSVTNYEMALALGKEGGIGILPARLSIKEQTNIVKKIKNYEMHFVEDPVRVRETTTVEYVLKKIERHGHSKIPIVDKNNTFLGMFTLQNYWESSSIPEDKATSIMLTPEKLPYTKNPDITIEEAKKLFETTKEKYLIILDKQDRLVKLAFKKDIKEIKIGSAISTYPGWQKRVEDNINAGVDLIVIDTSDAYNEFTENVLKEYKTKHKTPICAGNIVTKEGALFLMENGADIVKVGMSSGSICTTQREKAVGRSPMTALIEADKARKEFYKKTGKYISLIIDGGITSAADIIIALTIADAVMTGSYFNKFYEAAGEKFNEAGKETRIESEMKTVATWGEGSEKAQNLDRYNQTKKTFFAEGVEGTVPYKGRLKPTLKADIMRIKAALSNTGCQNLEKLRERAVIELISPHSSKIISETHNITKGG